MKAIVLTSLLFLFCISLQAQDLSNDDTDYIVDLISNLDEYVTWPESVTYEGGDKLLVLTIVGDSPINSKLKKLRGKETPNGKRIKVRVVALNEMPANSHILVYTGTSEADVKKALELLSGKGTLIIGMHEGFGELGCMLNFTHTAAIDDGKIGFELNRTSLDAASFQIKPEFHKLAKVLN